MIFARRLALAALASVAAAGGACGSDEGGGAGGSGAGGGSGGADGSAGAAATDAGQAGGPVALADACNGACEKIVEAGCTEEGTLAQCRSGCVNDYKPHEPTCVDETFALLACLGSSATFECSTDGFALPNGCDPSLQDFWACSACAAAPGDPPCEICSKSSCCAELEAFHAADGTANVVRCQALCPAADAACQTACLTAEPAADAAFDALTECRTASCAITCT